VSPVATHVERVRADVFEVHVSQGVDVYLVRMRAVRGATLLLGCRTKTGRAPASARRADVERAAIAAVQL
jgi:hypothetical protein